MVYKRILNLVLGQGIQGGGGHRDGINDISMGTRYLRIRFLPPTESLMNLKMIEEKLLLKYKLRIHGYISRIYLDAICFNSFLPILLNFLEKKKLSEVHLNLRNLDVSTFAFIMEYLRRREKMLRIYIDNFNLIHRKKGLRMLASVFVGMSGCLYCNDFRKEEIAELLRSVASQQGAIEAWTSLDFVFNNCYFELGFIEIAARAMKTDVVFNVVGDEASKSSSSSY